MIKKGYQTNIDDVRSLKRSFLGSIFVALIVFAIPSLAFAAFDSAMCNVYNITTGVAGKAFATFAVVAVGVGFYTGKVSWGLMVGTAVGIGLIFGAPTIVTAVSGNDFYECEDGVQVTTCSDDGCFACPVGFTGQNCDTCATGFTGSDCNQCQEGYTGDRCDECADGYTKSNGSCQQGCQASVSGVSDSVVVAGTSKTIKCDKDNFSGYIQYDCVDGVFTLSSGSCSCDTNFTGDNCDQCQEGYTGTNCSSCADNYTKVAGDVCEKDCNVSGQVGIIDKVALPRSGSLDCDKDHYEGLVNYKCVNGSFSISSGSCYCSTGYTSDDCTACDLGYASDGNGSCVGAKSCDFNGTVIAGITAKLTVLHGAQQNLTCDATGYSGSATYLCNNGEPQAIVPCYKKCSFQIAGVTDAITINSGESGTATCNAAKYSGNQVSFSCSDGVPTADKCLCATGYSGTDCSSCASGYSLVSGACKAQCPVSIAGVPTTVVNYGVSTVTCSSSGYSGATISYNCATGNTITGTCACKTGYTGATCSSCDSSNGYTMISGTCQQKCQVSIDGVSTTSVSPGAVSLVCDASGYSSLAPTLNSSTCSAGKTITGTCSCATGYVGAKCNSCDTGRDISTKCTTCLSGYTMSNNKCKAQCSITGITGIANGTKVNDGSTSIDCDSGYKGTVTYSCDNGTLSNVSSNCKANCSGGTMNTLSSGAVVHTFTSSGVLSCPAQMTGVQILVVAGGGSGGNHPNLDNGAGGGGGGGVVYGSNITLAADSSYTVTVGSGGSGITSSKNTCSSVKANYGKDSAFSGPSVSITAYGGAGGAGCGYVTGITGGSGGGGHCSGAGGSATKGVASGSGTYTVYGNSGGTATSCSSAGGGGGASGVGSASSGGAGFSSSISGATQVYGSGGGGGFGGSGGTNAGSGASNGNTSRSSIDAVAGYGGGGGANNVPSVASGSGGSGVVVVRY